MNQPTPSELTCAGQALPCQPGTWGPAEAEPMASEAGGWANPEVAS